MKTRPAIVTLLGSLVLAVNFAATSQVAIAKPGAAGRFVGLSHYYRWQ